MLAHQLPVLPAVGEFLDALGDLFSSACAVGSGSALTDNVGDDGAVAYDEDLANRIRELIAAQAGVSERKMFGGLAFLIGGHMSVAVSRQGGLMVRVGPADTEVLLAKPHARPFEMRGRPLQGWVRVDADGVRTRRQLERWVGRGVAHARSLPPKPGR